MISTDDNSLVGNFTYTYDADIAAGDCPIRLKMTSKAIQWSLNTHCHDAGERCLSHAPTNQPDVVLFAPGAVEVNFVEHLVHRPAASML